MNTLQNISEILQTRVVIQSDADFTPVGKRRVKIVTHQISGEKAPAHIRWYVGQSAFRSMPLTQDNIKLSSDWENLR